MQQLLRLHIFRCPGDGLAFAVSIQAGRQSLKLLLEEICPCTCSLPAGADVTHPTGFNKVIPSIASVVASLNRHATHYCERSRLQAHRTEIIQVGGRCFLGLCSCPGYAC